MTHIKVYQKIDPRFNNQRLLRESQVVRSDMQSLMESWNSYTSSEFVNEGLQDTIVQKIKDLLASVNQKLNQFKVLFKITHIKKIKI